MGGAGVVIVFPDSTNIATMHFRTEAFAGTTVPRMELTGCIVALERARHIESLRDIGRARLHTDSLYVVHNYPRALHVWSKGNNKWRLSSGAPVMNADLWKSLLTAMRHLGVPCDIHWVKGHKDSVPQKQADALAKKARSSTFVTPGTNIVRRKTFETFAKAGNIQPQGQRIMLHVIASQDLPLHNEYRYQVEVLSKGPQYKNSAFVFSDVPLHTGHDFSVRLNSDPKYPRIVKVFRDLTLERRAAENASQST